MQKYQQRIDDLAEQEGYHVARMVGRFLIVVAPVDRFEDVDEAIAMCQDVFVHKLSSALPIDAQAQEVIHNLCTGQEVTADFCERTAYAVAQVISHARQQFRQYLPALN